MSWLSGIAVSAPQVALQQQAGEGLLGLAWSLARLMQSPQHFPLRLLEGSCCGGQSQQPCLPSTSTFVLHFGASCKSCHLGRKTGSVQTRCILGVQLPERPLSGDSKLGVHCQGSVASPIFLHSPTGSHGRRSLAGRSQLSFHVAKPFCGRGELGRGRGLEAARALSGSSAVSQAACCRQWLCLTALFLSCLGFS